MTAAVLVGALAAWGISLVVTGLVPARVSLGDALERLDAPATVADDSPAQWWVRLLGVPLVDTRFGQAWTRPASRDLRVIGRSTAEHLARTVALVAVALLWAPATFGLIALGGVDVTWVLPLWVSIVLGAVALVVPALEVRAEAAERRRSFRHALGCFLDLVAVRLAGGAGVDSALAGSAAAGDGWAFAELRQALTDARLRGEPSWNGLAHLGEAIGVGELQELAASAGLAGDEGARVRVSIAAKARAIRRPSSARVSASSASTASRTARTTPSRTASSRAGPAR